MSIKSEIKVEHKFYSKNCKKSTEFQKMAKNQSKFQKVHIFGSEHLKQDRTQFYSKKQTEN